MFLYLLVAGIPSIPLRCNYLLNTVFTGILLGIKSRNSFQRRPTPRDYIPKTHREGPPVAKKRIYIAGKLNDLACDYLQNVHRMIHLADAVRRAGFAVFVPCLDLLMGVTLGDYHYADYFDNSAIWLEVAEAVLLVPGWKSSSGTKREIAQARQLGIPVFNSLEELCLWRDSDERTLKGV